MRVPGLGPWLWDLGEAIQLAWAAGPLLYEEGACGRWEVCWFSSNSAEEYFLALCPEQKTVFLDPCFLLFNAKCFGIFCF